MPAGQGYQVWTDQNPPAGDDPINQEGFLWEHPQAGKVFYDPKTRSFQPVDDATWKKNAIAPAPLAGEQAAAVETAEPPAAAAAAGGAGMLNKARMGTFTEHAQERGRAGMEQAVQIEAQKERDRQADPFSALGLGDKAGAMQMWESGNFETPEEAVAAYLQEKNAATEQAAAVEAAVPPQ